MRALSLLTITLSTTLASGLLAEDAKKSSLTDEQKKEIQNTVKDLLKAEPELVYTALLEHQKKEENKAREEGQKAIKTEQKAIFEDTEDPIIGNPKGGVVMVVFMDPYCGYCRKFQPILHKAVKNHKDLKIIYKALPVLGPESKKAAEEELAANTMGRFVDYHEAVYESSVRSRQDRMELAKKNNIDVTKLKEAMNSDKVDKHLNRNKQLAGKLNINGTPAFIINGELVPGFVEADTLDTMIKQAAQKN